MENPIQTVKTAVSVPKIIGFLALGVAVFALLDVLKVTNWFLYPYTSARDAINRARAN